MGGQTGRHVNFFCCMVLLWDKIVGWERHSTIQQGLLHNETIYNGNMEKWRNHMVAVVYWLPHDMESTRVQRHSPGGQRWGAIPRHCTTIHSLLQRKPSKWHNKFKWIANLCIPCNHAPHACTMLYVHGGSDGWRPDGWMDRWVSGWMNEWLYVMQFKLQTNWVNEISGLITKMCLAHQQQMDCVVETTPPPPRQPKGVNI